MHEGGPTSHPLRFHRVGFIPLPLGHGRPQVLDQDGNTAGIERDWIANQSGDYSIDDLNKSCLAQFTNHWKCLDNHNHQLWQCRPFEWKLNKCAFDNLVSLLASKPRLRKTNPLTGPFPRQKLEKKIPNQPVNVVPVELRPQQILADRKFRSIEGKPFAAGKEEAQ